MMLMTATTMIYNILVSAYMIVGTSLLVMLCTGTQYYKNNLQ